MEKELTEQEAIKLLDEEYYKHCLEIKKKYEGVRMPGRDGGDTQDRKELSQECGRRYIKIKTEFQDHKTLPESEVMKIVMGDF